MNVLSQLKLLPNILMNNNSSVFLASDSIILTAFTTDNIVSRLIRAIGQFLYFVSKWMMYMIDVIYFYILQLAGIGADVSIVDSARTDMTFSLLLDNKDEVTKIIKNFIVIALVLIIVTAIIAIIKQQANSLKDKKAKNNPTGEVMKGVLKACVLLFVTPIIAILSIVASSVLLQSLFNATNLSDTKSLSARIFNVSASAANKYKTYADKGVRIPIKYKFSGENKDNAINYAVKMIGNESFPDIQYFDVNEIFLSTTFTDPVLGEEIKRGTYKSGTDAWLNDVYYKYFDTSDDYRYNNTATIDWDSYKLMQTHRNEYYAMSDVIAYALDSMEPFYFITIQELLESLAFIDANVILENILENYNVRVLDNAGESIGMDPTQVTDIEAIKNALKGTATYRAISYISNYEGEQYTYMHIKDAEDEMEGAKFIIAYQMDADTTVYTLDVSGDYYTNGSTSSQEKRKDNQFYYKDSANARYKAIDIFYYYNTDREDFVKAPTLNSGGAIDYNTYKTGGYYYKIGSDYVEINSQNFAKISYLDKDGNHKPIADANFYTSEKQTYYFPLLNGVNMGGYKPFSSQYIGNFSIITARGIFDESSYPTAIRRTSGGDIMFYRDDLELVANGSVSDFGTLDQIEAESDSEESEDQGLFGKVVSTVKSGWSSVKSFFSKLFNPLKLVPDLKLNPSAMSTTYTKKTTSVYVLNDSRLHISYFYSDDFTAQMSKKLHGININYLFDVMQINPVTLIVGATIFMKIMITAVFGLVNRAFNLFILFLIYPVACATIPLDDTSGATKSGAYAKWTSKYIQLLFSTYGLIIGLNFSFVVIPVIDEITFFTPQNLQENNILRRIAEALSNPLLIFNIGGDIFKPNFNLTCIYLNKLLRIIFQIAAFSLVTSANGKGDNYYEVIKTVVGTGPGVLEDSPADSVKKTLKKMTKVVNMVTNPIATVKNTLEKGKEVAGEVFSALPGSAIIAEAKTRSKQFDNQRKMDDSRKALIKALENKESKESVEAKLKEYQSLHKTGKK